MAVSAFDSDKMSPEAFREWMEEQFFDSDALAATLHVHRITISHWRTGKHDIKYQTLLALREIERDKAGRRDRKNARAEVERVTQQARATVKAVRQRSRSASAATV